MFKKPPKDSTVPFLHHHTSNLEKANATLEQNNHLLYLRVANLVTEQERLKRLNRFLLILAFISFTLFIYTFLAQRHTRSNPSRLKALSCITQPYPTQQKGSI